MKDISLPLLMPGDPKNLLSDEARRRITRAHIQSEKIAWEAEVAVEARGVDPFSEAADRVRNKANLAKARAVLKVVHQEFGRLRIFLAEFRAVMKQEIDGAVGSLGLSDIQQALLESEFCYPPEDSRVFATPPKPPSESEGDLAPAAQESCGRRQTVDEFLRRCNGASPVVIRRNHIWKAIGHHNGRQFEYWQACDDKATRADNHNFERILAMEPKQFLALLRKKGLVRSSL